MYHEIFRFRSKTNSQSIAKFAFFPKKKSITSHRQQRQRIQQIPSRPGYNAIFNASYLDDIAEQLKTWDCKRVLLVHSKALNENTSKIQDLRKALANLIVGGKAGVGSHSLYRGGTTTTRFKIIDRPR